MGDAVALRQFAAELQEHRPVLDGGDAFGDDLPVQRRGQAEHAAENGQVVGIVEHVAHEALVDLELCNREAFEVGQRRVAGAEIIEGKSDADFPAGLDDLRDARKIFQGAGFQYLHFECAGVERRVCREPGAQALDEVGLLQLTRTDVDTDRNVEADGAPGFELQQCGFDHPFTDFDCQRMFFDDRQENGR